MTNKIKGTGDSKESGEPGNSRGKKKVKTPFYYHLKDELFYETFYKDNEDFSPDRIDYLLKLLDMEDPIDTQEIEEARLQFEKNFKALSKKRRRKRKMKGFFNKMAGIAAVVMFTFIIADITTNAVMDESLFHMFSRWKNQVTVRPAQEDVVEEISSFAEDETRYSYSLEEFVNYFGKDFLICSWLPEGSMLSEIYVNNIGENQVIAWEYTNSNIKDYKIEVWMHRSTVNATASVAGTFIGDEEFEVKEIIGNKVTYYSNNDSLLAGFDYAGWWYLVNVSPYDEDILTSVLKGLVRYEAFE